MEREDIHAILTQNNLESGKSKWKDVYSAPCDESVKKAKDN